MEEGSLFQRMKQIFHEDEMDEEMQKEAAALIRNIFRYMDKDAKDIMTHRKNIVAIDGDWSLEEALKFMLDERFSRFPVYQEDIDEIIGIIHLRDATSGYLDESKRGCPVKELKEYLRPVLIIQNDVGNRHSPTVICAAITSRMNKAKLPTHVEIDARRYHIVKNSVVLLEQIRTIDKQRLRDLVCHLDEEIMNKVDEAIRISFELHT